MSNFSQNLSGNLRDALRDHLLQHAVRTDGPFTLRSGAVSSWYMDARQTTFDGLGARIVGETLASLVHNDAVAVGGLTMGADPVALATAISATRSGKSLRAFSIRKEAKTHGTGGRLVGPVVSGDAVTIVEDTTTTGGAIIEAMEAAQAEGLVVLEVICLVDRSAGVAGAEMTARGIPFYAVFVPEDLGLE